MNMNITPKGIIIALLLIVMTAAIIFLSIKVTAPCDCDCVSEMKAAYTGGGSDGLTLLIQQIEKSKLAIINMPDNQSYAITNPKYCQEILQAAAQQQK